MGREIDRQSEGQTDRWTELNSYDPLSEKRMQ